MSGRQTGPAKIREFCRQFYVFNDLLYDVMSLVLLHSDELDQTLINDQLVRFQNDEK